MPDLDLSFRPRKASPPKRLTARLFARQFLRHPQIQLLLLFGIVSGAAAILTFGLTPAEGLGILALLLVYPFAEYALHRFVLHATIWCRWEATARLWSILHHWHHAHPADTQALFAPPVPLLIGATLLSLPVGWLAGGPEGAGAAFSAGFFLMVFYEYMHAGAHLVAEPATRWGKAMQHRHMLHHFHSEHVNFGTTTPLVDWLLKTSLTDPEAYPRSATARTLGYSGALAARYPSLATIESGTQRPRFR